MDVELDTDSITDFRTIDDYIETKQLPSTLKRLWNKLGDGHTPEPTEILISLIYYATLEMGFVPVKLSTDLYSKLPTHWAYRFAAQVPFYGCDVVADELIQQRKEMNDGLRKFYKFHLILANIVDNGTLLIVNNVFNKTGLLVTLCSDPTGMPPGQTIEITSSVMLNLNEFVSLDATNQIELINVTQFLAKVKSELIGPVRNALLLHEGLPHAAINGLPKDALWSIFECLRNDLPSLQALSQTCTFLRNMSIDYLNESNIQLERRIPTRIVRDLQNRMLPCLPRFYPPFGFNPWAFPY